MEQTLDGTHILEVKMDLEPSLRCHRKKVSDCDIEMWLVTSKFLLHSSFHALFQLVLSFFQTPSQIRLKS